MKTLRCLAGSLFFAVLVVGCASGQRQALRSLEAGVCPPVIINPGERSAHARERYGEAVTDNELANYRDREIANCEQRVAAGDASALNTVLEYWYAQGDSQRVVAAYKSYLEKGTDEAELAAASSSLYTLYSEGQTGLAPDPDAAFHYLGLAAKYDPQAFELRYADALYAKGLYADAAAHYDTMLAREPAGADLTKGEICEINLKLAELYFLGRGVRENWYVGFYYWLQGLSMAADPEWGSCDRFTYYDHKRFAFESERKRVIEHRLQYLGSADRNRIKVAWETPGEGLASIAALDFRRPHMTEPDRVALPATPTEMPGAAPVTSDSAAWPAWEPLGGDLCQWHASHLPLSWSDVFQLRSGAIWSVKSQAGTTQSTGSAVAVSPTTLLTNCHLIQDPAAVTLLKAGRAMRAGVLAADREGDRCILQAAEPLPTYVASARQEHGLLVGEDVAAIGNPKGLDISLSRGLVAQKRSKNGKAYVQTDAAISSGSSGGGLFDTAGNLVGVTTFKVSTGESLNFAIAIDEFCR